MATAPADEQVAIRRKFARLDVRCPARIRIGNRQYAGFIENIAEGGARFTTMSPVREKGPVRLLLPDLPAISGEIRWSEPHGGGVCFHLRLSEKVLEDWARSRLKMTIEERRD